MKSIRALDLNDKLQKNKSIWIVQYENYIHMELRISCRRHKIWQPTVIQAQYHIIHCKSQTTSTMSVCDSALFIDE